MRVLNAGGEESRSRFFADRLAPYQERIALALAATNAADAFYFAERSKARVLLDVIRGDRIPVTKAMTGAERRHEVELRTSLTSANSELLVRRAGDAPRRGARRRRCSASATNAASPTKTSRRGCTPRIRSCASAAPTSPAIRAAEAQQLLSGPSEAIVEFVAGPDRTHAFVISATGLRVFALTASTAGDRPPGPTVSRSAREPRSPRGRRPPGVSTRSSSGPMRSALSGKTALIIVPDGVLWNLPFQALQGSDGRYLIEDAAVSYAPSVTVLRETMRPRAARPASSTLIAFGNPAAAAKRRSR